MRHSDPCRLNCLRKLKALAPDVPVVVLSDPGDGATVAQCCIDGADGHVIRPFASEDLSRAVIEVTQGQWALCSKAQAEVKDCLRHLSSGPWCGKLTWREREVMQLVARGAPNKDIAEKLGIGEGTVHRHMHDICHKLGARNREEARRKFLAVR